MRFIGPRTAEQRGCRCTHLSPGVRPYPSTSDGGDGDRSARRTPAIQPSAEADAGVHETRLKWPSKIRNFGGGLVGAFQAFGIG